MAEGQTELEELKRSADLLGLVRSHGVSLSRAGADLLGLCPFHEETTPSFRVTPSKNLWHCFGCGKGGSAVDWLMHTRGLSVREAVAILREQAGSPSLPSRPEPPSAVAVVSAPPASPDTMPVMPVDRQPEPLSPSRFWSNRESTEQDLLWAVLEHYHGSLWASEACRAYLERRGLWDESLVRTFRLGYADRSLGLAIPGKQLRAGAHARERLQLAGVIRDTGHEHLNGSLVVPILGETVKGQWQERGQRQVLGMYGRKVNTGLRAGTPNHLYLSGQMRGVFHASGALEAARDAGGTVILCEALLDALTLWRWGFRNVTTAYGVRGVSKDLWRYLTESGFSRVVLAFDADEAGDVAASSLAERLQGAGLEVGRLPLPRGEDVNSFAVGSTNPAQCLGDALSRAFGRESWQPVEAVAIETKTESVKPEKAKSPSSLAAETPAVVPQAALPEIPAVTESVPEAVRPVDGFVEEGDALLWTSGDRRWRVLGLSSARPLDHLRLNLRVTRGDHFHLDTLDLYLSKSREAFVRTASIELGVDPEVIKRDLGRLVLRLEERLHAQVEAARHPPAPAAVELSEEAHSQALAVLREPGYLLILLSDLEATGMVGEEVNKLLCWLALTSRRLDSPLGLLIQSTSAAGKSSLLEGVLRTMPEEEVIRYSAVSGQSLFYMGNLDLRHKVLYIAEEEGARRASYSLKLLQSDGVLSMASTTKDPESGQLVTKEYRTEGPVALAMTTTSPEIDPELQNRCLVVSVDESREQTEAIHRRQRESLTREGMVRRRETASRLELWRNAQRLLAPLDVVNPYAQDLSFASHQTRTRRDQVKYLSLVSAVALAHQHRKVRHQDAHGEYIEADLDDIELATFLAGHALGRSLDDLPPQTARLWRVLCGEVRNAAEQEGCDADLFRFTRRWAREHTHWGDTQLKLHLHRLEELELVTVSRSAQGSSYRLACLEESAPGLVSSGLPRLSSLRAKYPGHRYDGTWSGFCARWSGQVVMRSEGGRGGSRPVGVVEDAPAKFDEMGVSGFMAMPESVADSLPVGGVGKAYEEEDLSTESVVMSYPDKDPRGTGSSGRERVAA